MITLDDLQSIMPYSGKRAQVFLAPLNTAMEEFEINTPLRQAAFLAQVAHESGSLRYVKEIASGEAYEGRTDLGNIQPGDGVRFKGRGLLQVTGRDAYDKCGKALGLDLLSNPELLEETNNAARSAGWVWRDFKRLNELADAGNFEKITRRINGGLNGYPERLAYYERAKEALA